MTDVPLIAKSRRRPQSCSSPRISPRTVFGIMMAVIVLGFAVVHAVRAATGAPVPSNWLEFDLLVSGTALAFAAFLLLYDRSYRVCWGDETLRVRLPGLSWRLRLQDELIVPVGGITAVTIEDTPVMPALRNILVWYSLAGESANVPLSPVLLAQAELREIILWIVDQSGASVDDRLHDLGR